MDSNKFKSWCLDCSRVRTIRGHKLENPQRNQSGGNNHQNKQSKLISLHEARNILLNGL